MLKTLFVVSIAMTGSLFIPLNLHAEDPIPPVPPGKSLPPASSGGAAGSSNKNSTGQQYRLGANSNHPGQPGQRLEKLKEQLGLTPAQIDKIKPIFEKSGAQLKALHENTSLSVEQKRTKLREIFVASFQQIKPILTPAQLAKWKQLREERRKSAGTT